MTDLRSRLKPLFRRSSNTSALKRQASPSSTRNDLETDRNWSRSSSGLPKAKKAASIIPAPEEKEPAPTSTSSVPPIPTTQKLHPAKVASPPHTLDLQPEPPKIIPLGDQNPILTVEEPTPEIRDSPEGSIASGPATETPHLTEAFTNAELHPSSATVGNIRNSMLKSPLRIASRLIPTESQEMQNRDYFGRGPNGSSMQSAQHRKIWVKRPGSSATQVTINEDDLVDEVRDMILKKYANSLGRNFDSPDVVLRVMARSQSARHSHSERSIGPEEVMWEVVEMYYTGGQTVEEALIIDVPRRTPKHSPRIAMPYYFTDDLRPGENGTDYFPPMPVAGQQSNHQTSSLAVSNGHGSSQRLQQHSIAVLETGQVPTLPSPGARSTARYGHRPKYGRTHTTSPTVSSGVNNSMNHENLKAQNVPSMPTPPLPVELQPHRVDTPPPPRISSPRPKTNKRTKKPVDRNPEPVGLLDGAVPPINVLIVEDNIINLRLLEAFMKRLKVRWSTAMNGEIAVNRWREGGFHLVLMDIQLPVMNGLDATKEIRRLERVNNIGVFSNSASSTPTFPHGGDLDGTAEGEDKLMNTALFKSPVIIVALTASSLQSDRHEALAAGCNDFLTKPVAFDWLSRKVMEWGCMQALIDFDGWRKWKDFSQTTKPKLPDALEKKSTPIKGPTNKSLENAANGKSRKVSLGDGMGSDTGTDTNGDSGSGNEVLVRP